MAQKGLFLGILLRDTDAFDMVPVLTGVTLDHLKVGVLWELAHTNLFKRNGTGDNLLGLVVVELFGIKDDLLVVVRRDELPIASKDTILQGPLTLFTRIWSV